MTQEEIGHHTTNLQVHKGVHGWVLAPSTAPHQASCYSPAQGHSPGNKKTPTRRRSNMRDCLSPFNRSRESPSSKAAKSFPMARCLSCFEKKKKKII